MPEWKHSITDNDEASRIFAHHLGYAILNCGNIENLTYAYAATLDGTNFFETGLSGKLFSERKKAVLQSLKAASLSDDLRNEALELWHETNEIMKVRNLVAHNPINRVEIETPEGEQRVLVGVVDMAISAATNIRSLDAGKIENLANRASELSHKLDQCRSRIQRELSGHGPTPEQ